MQLLQYFPVLRPTAGGVPASTLTLVRALRAAGHSVSLVGIDSDGSEPATLVPAPAAGMAFTGKIVPILERLITEAEVLHLHGLFASGNWWMARRARRLGTPYVVSLHGQLSPWSMRAKAMKKRAFMSAFGNSILRHAALVHATSGAELDAASKRLPRSARAEITAPMVDLNECVAGPNRHRAAIPTSDLPTLLFLGRLHSTKSPEIAVDALKHLHDAGVACRLILAGPGDERYVDLLRRRAGLGGLDDSVIFTGEVDARAKSALYRQAEMLVLPTQHENFGIVLVEALGSGLPVITTRAVGICEELASSGGAVIVDRTAAAVGEAAADLLADPERRRFMGEAGRTWARENYDKSRCLARFEAIYSKAALSASRR